MRECTHKWSGKGFVNRLINRLPVELHIPGGYQYCGPGTKLQERLARGDSGINPLDAACKEHDIAYSKNRENLEIRHAADKVLTEKAWTRVLAQDAGLLEKAAAWSVANIMKVKTKLGMGVRQKRKIRKNKKKKKGGSHILPKTKGGSYMLPKTTGTRKKKTGGRHVLRKKKAINLRNIIHAAKASMRPGRDAVKTALGGARKAVKLAGGKGQVKSPRILPIPRKIGGLLPFLIPIFSALSAASALACGAAGIAKAVNDASIAKRDLEENKRHNQTMESIALSGEGLYLKPYKKVRVFI